MKAVVFDQFGDPADVLHVQERPLPQPKAGEVRVRMLASPINPSDLLVVRGEYGRLPPLPATPGFEGVGRVDAAGGGLLGRWRLGRRVALLSGAGGTWAEYAVVSARQVVPLPKAVPDDQGAFFFVNPASALVMTRQVLRVSPGAWLLQSAAAGALGRMVIRLGKEYGFRTINVVRRPEQADELRGLGADAVINSSAGPIDEQVRSLTQGHGVRFALDAVGGALGGQLVRCLAPGGRLLVYGTLSGEPLPLDSRALMVQQASVEGFWLSNWMRGQNAVHLLRLVRRIGRLLAAGVLTSEVAATYALDDIGAAVKQAALPGRGGKILLRLGSSS